MTILLLFIIYLAFIALGLPDSLLGTSWPVSHLMFNVPLSYSGIIIFLISLCTIISSLLTDKLTKKLTSQIVVVISVLLTSIALLGISFSSKFYMLIIFSIPLGLGAGAVDATLNNYVALHFSSKQMNWLHCFWGIGASVSPYIMGYFLSKNNNWQGGYKCVGIILAIISVILFISLPIWKKQKENIIVDNNENVSKAKSLKELLSLKGLILLLIAFFCYCSIESICFNWTSSYLVIAKDFKESLAAMLTSTIYIGMTLSRFLSGFISNKLGDKKMIRLGYLIIFIGITLILLSFNNEVLLIIGLLLLGFGCGPIYPSIIHSIPFRYNKENSQAIVGIAMACAYVGFTCISPIFGLIAQYIDIRLFSICLLVFIVLGYLLIELSYKKKV